MARDRAKANAFFGQKTDPAMGWLWVILDYGWEYLPSRFKNHKKPKALVVVVLLVFGWIQALIQYHKDNQSERDMDYFKKQLTLANVSLTNTTLTIKGMNDGGDAYPEPAFGFSEGTNLLSVYVNVHGNYPLRSVSAKVLNETKHLEFSLTNHTDAPPKSETVCERFVGDISQHWWNMGPHLCNVPLDPSRTNYIRIDLNAVNGFSWQIYKFSQVSNGWYVDLHYRLRRIQEKVSIDPTNWGHAILAY